MPQEETAYLHGLCALRTRVSAVRLRRLLADTGSSEAAWNASDEQLTRSGFTNTATGVFRNHRQSWKMEEEFRRLTDVGCTFVRETDDTYPELLRHIYDPPLALYVRGTLRPSQCTVAVVGSRKATPYGRTVTALIARPLAARGVTIASGLAYGVDSEAHRAALDVHAYTIAVLGSGVDDASLYPRAHRALAASIIERGGAVISEYPPGTAARAEYFPERNRIIAGLSHAVVVVEAAIGSGALITARSALAENREVLAVPGPVTSPFSEGTNRLLKDGASPACTADDVLEALALTNALRLPLAPRAHAAAAPARDAGPAGPQPAGTPAAILKALTKTPMELDALITATTLPPHEVSAALSLLELDGSVRDVGGKQYVRC